MLDLAGRKLLEEKTDELVDLATKLVDEPFMKKKGGKEEEAYIYREVERSQIRNLQDMAGETDSIKAIVLFVQYQMGRKNIPKAWGDKLIKVINEKIGEMADGNPVMQLEMIRTFLGLVGRYYVYRNNAGGSA